MAIKVGDIEKIITSPQAQAVEKIVTEKVAISNAPVPVDYTKDPRTQVSKFPIEPVNVTDVIGVDYDPYDIDFGGYDQHSDIWNPNIPFHNMRQRHVGQKAFFAGYGATMPLPKCPPLWGDVSHYWDTMVFVGWVAYEGIRVFGGAISAIILAKLGGVV
jgi:hypothetical protein